MASEAPATEIWLPIPGYDGYEASNTMQVRSVDHEISYINRWGSVTTRISKGKGKLSPGVSKKDGYLRLQLGKGKRVTLHRAICLAFHGLPPSEDSVVRHLDDDRSNNSPENLAWGSASDNMKDSRRNGTWNNQYSVRRGCGKPGHPEEYDTVRKDGHRQCSYCRREYDLRYWKENQDRLREYNTMKAREYRAARKS